MSEVAEAVETVDSNMSAEVDGISPEVPSSDGEQHVSDLDVLNDESEPKTADDLANTAEEATSPEKTDEEKAAEAKTEDAKTDEEKAADKAKEGAGEESGAVKALRKAIDADPAIKEALEKNPRFRNKIYTDARRSEALNGYTRHFATPEIAELAAGDLKELDGFERDFRNPEAPRAFFERLHDADVVFENGEPVIENGSPKTKGNYERVMNYYRQQVLFPTIEGLAERRAEEDPEFDLEAAKGALNLVRQILGDKVPTVQKPAKPAPAESGSEEIDESKLSPKLRELVEKGKAAQAHERETQQQGDAEYGKAIKESITTESKKVITARVDEVGKLLSQPVRQRIVDDAFRELNKMAVEDVGYIRLRDSLYANRTPEAKQKLVVNAKNFVQARMNDVVVRLVREFSAAPIAKNQATHEKLKTQKDNREPKASGGVSQPSRPDDAATIARAQKLSKQINGRSLNEYEILSVEDILPELEERARRQAKR